jgi:hypothetical protein
LRKRFAFVAGNDGHPSAGDHWHTSALGCGNAAMQQVCWTVDAGQSNVASRSETSGPRGPV